MDLGTPPPPSLGFSVLFLTDAFWYYLINKLKIRMLYKISSGIGFTPPTPFWNNSLKR